MQRLAIALALGCLLHSSPAYPVRAAAAAPCDFDHRIAYGTSFQPEHPCDGQPVTLVVHACAECNHLIAGWLDGAIHLRFLSRQVCPRIPCQPESLVIPLGKLAAGAHRFLVDVSARVLIAGTDSAFCEVSQLDTLEFRVGTCPPPSELPFVTRVQIGAPIPCPGDSFPVLVSGVFPNQCYDLRGFGLSPAQPMHPLPGPPVLRLLVAVAPGAEACLGPPQPFHASMRLPGLPSGPYHLIVEEAWTAWDDTTQVDSLFTATFPFEVAVDCTTSGPRLPRPFVSRIQVGPPASPICPGDSIPVVIGGVFPDACWELRGVELLPFRPGTPPGTPPITPTAPTSGGSGSSFSIAIASSKRSALASTLP